MGVDIYAVLQVSKNKLCFSVTHYDKVNKNTIIVYSKTAKEANILDDNYVISNPEHIKKVLSKLITDYEVIAKNRLSHIILVLPTQAVHVKESEVNVIKKSERFEISQEIKEKLLEDLKNDMYHDNREVIKIKPYFWKYDNRKSFTFEEGISVNRVDLVGYNYSVSKDVLSSHRSIILGNDREVLITIPENYAKAFRIVPKNIFMKHPLIVADVNRESWNASLYVNEANIEILKYEAYQSLDGIIGTIANELKIKEAHVSNYLFGLLDFYRNNNSENNNVDVVYFRKNYIQGTVEKTKKQVLSLFEEKISILIRQIDLIVSKRITNIDNIRIFLTGDIQKISGIDSIIASTSKYSNKFNIYIPNGIGEKGPNDTVALGATEYAVLFNYNRKDGAYFTSIGQNKQIEPGNAINEEIDVPDGYTILPEYKKQIEEERKYNQYVASNNNEAISKLPDDDYRQRGSSQNIYESQVLNRDQYVNNDYNIPNLNNNINSFDSMNNNSYQQSNQNIYNQNSSLGQVHNNQNLNQNQIYEQNNILNSQSNIPQNLGGDSAQSNVGHQINAPNSYSQNQIINNNMSENNDYNQMLSNKINNFNNQDMFNQNIASSNNQQLNQNNMINNNFQSNQLNEMYNDKLYNQQLNQSINQQLNQNLEQEMYIQNLNPNLEQETYNQNQNIYGNMHLNNNNIYNENQFNQNQNNLYNQNQNNLYNQNQFGQNQNDMYNNNQFNQNQNSIYNDLNDGINMDLLKEYPGQNQNNLRQDNLNQMNNYNLQNGNYGSNNINDNYQNKAPFLNQMNSDLSNQLQQYAFGNSSQNNDSGILKHAAPTNYGFNQNSSSNINSKQAPNDNSQRESMILPNGQIFKF